MIVFTEFSMNLLFRELNKLPPNRIVSVLNDLDEPNAYYTICEFNHTILNFCFFHFQKAK